jgi:hypothetical protein
MNLDSELEKEIEEIEFTLSEDFHKIRFELSQYKIQLNQLAEENKQVESVLNLIQMIF